MSNLGSRLSKLMLLAALLSLPILATASVSAEDQVATETTPDACKAIGNQADLAACLSTLRTGLEKQLQEGAAAIKSLTDAQKGDLEDKCKIQTLDSKTNEDAKVTEARCRKAIDVISQAWSSSLKKVAAANLEQQAKLIRASKMNDPEGLQRLQNVVDDRQAAIVTAVGNSAQGLAKAVDLTLKTGETLEKIAAPRTEAALADLGKTVTAAATTAIKAWQAKVLAAHTPSDQFLANEIAAKKFQADAEKEAFGQITDQDREGFIRRIVCTWIPKDVNSTSPIDSLACGKAGLKVSGEEISKVYVTGIPPGGVAQAGTGELTGNPSISSGSETMNGNTNLIIVLHTKKVFGTTYGTIVPNMEPVELKKMLEQDPQSGFQPSNTSQINLLTKGRSPSLEIAITAGGTTKTASIPIERARWKFESGGFIAFSSAVGEQVVKHVDSSDPSKIVIDRIRKSDSVSQESGIFANFIPENYQKIGFGLGFATNSDGPPSVYLGANLRLTTFGNRGLASIGGGVALRSVERFPDLEARLKESMNMKDEEGKPIELVLPPDSSLLTGERQSKIGWFIGISLGFRFGPIGSATDEN